jgi:serine protease Do
MQHSNAHKLTGSRWQQRCIIGLWLLIFGLLQPHWAQAQAPVPPAARELSNAFTEVSRRALPAVVFITVVKTTEAPGLSNNPADLFGEEFFERFFGRRFPEGRQPREFRQQGQGSGFIISSDGLILTNHHVVGDADRVTVRLTDGREFTAKIVGTDPPSDIAVIKIESQGLPVLPLGNSDAMEVGDWVIAAGNPFGLTQSITVGVVSAKGRSRLGITDFEDFIQTDAAINPGNSGGPLINLRGEVVGVNTAIFSRSGGYMGIGFAIPINMVKAIKDQLVTQGKVVRGFMGVHIQELTRALADSLNLQTTEGALVADVSPGSPADKAGIKRGDVIVSFNGHAVQDPGQLRNMVAQTAPGTKAKLQILRDNRSQELTVALAELPREQTTAQANSGETQPSAKLGFNVQNLSPELARQLGHDSTDGVLVTQIDPNSEAYQAGLRRGMIIRQVNRRDVRNMEEFRRALGQSEQSKRVLLLVEDQEATRYIAFNLA